MKEHAQLRAGLLAVRAGLDDIEGTATNDAGTITATVGGRGNVRELVLDRRVYRDANAAALADDILATLRAAAEKAADEAFQLTTKALGATR
jgi:DNA-binding protein YbaB